MDEPAPIAFANTRSSPGRDRIATLAQWRAWLAERPGIRAAGRRIDADGLQLIRGVRDDVQAALRAAAAGQPPDAAVTARLSHLAGTRAPATLRWRAGRAVLQVAPGADPALAVAHQLARMTLDLLVAGPPIACCKGQGCLKVFVASRADRRWCDSAVCGNRARVGAFSRRRRGTAGPRP